MKKEAQIDMQNSCLRDIYGKHMDLHKDIVDRTNLFIAILTFLLGLALYKIIDPSFFTLNKYLIASFACLAATSFTCLIICLSAIIPKIKGLDKNNVFYYGDFIMNMSINDYSKKLGDVLSNPNKLKDAYVTELFELSQNVLLPSYNKIRIASVVLLFGIALSCVLMVLGFLL